MHGVRFISIFTARQSAVLAIIDMTSDSEKLNPLHHKTVELEGGTFLE